jgi:hypothetical protein
MYFSKKVVDIFYYDLSGQHQFKLQYHPHKLACKLEIPRKLIYITKS